MELIPRAIEPVVGGHLEERRPWSYCFQREFLDGQSETKGF
jgi:hypothetical protein